MVARGQAETHHVRIGARNHIGEQVKSRGRAIVRGEDRQGAGTIVRLIQGHRHSRQAGFIAILNAVSIVITPDKIPDHRILAIQKAIPNQSLTAIERHIQRRRRRVGISCRDRRRHRVATRGQIRHSIGAVGTGGGRRHQGRAVIYADGQAGQTIGIREVHQSVAVYVHLHQTADTTNLRKAEIGIAHIRGDHRHGDDAVRVPGNDAVNAFSGMHPARRQAHGRSRKTDVAGIGAQLHIGRSGGDARKGVGPVRPHRHAGQHIAARIQ